MSLMSSMLKATKSAISLNGVNVALTGYFSYDAYQEAKRSGSGTVGALGSAAMPMALPLLLPGGMLGYLGFELATSAPGLAADAYRSIRDYRRKLGQEQRHFAFQNASFQENQQTFTMRQAAMAIAERTRYNRDIALQGHEAKYMMK